MNIYPQRVVAVVNAPAKRGYAYVQAVVYELQPRKDGVLTYRRDPARYAWPHRSKRLAEEEAQELAERLNIPYWPHVRHHMPAEEAAKLYQEVAHAER